MIKRRRVFVLISLLFGLLFVAFSNLFIGNPCANGIRSAEVLRDRVFFATSSWCNLTELAGSEFYEYIPELDTKNTQ